MLQYYAKHTPHEEFQRFSTPRHDNVWVYGDAITESDLSDVTQRFGLDRNIVYDVRDGDELPRVEYSDGNMYVFLRVPERTKRGDVTTSPLLAIVTLKAFLTLASTNTFSPDHLAHVTGGLRSSDTSSLLTSAFAAVISEYEDLIKQTAHYIKDTSRRLRTHEITNKDFIHFVTIEDNLNEYRLSLDSMLTVARRLCENKHDVLSAADIEAIDDVVLYIQQLLVAIGSHSQSVTSIRNAYGTIANNTLNQRMKTLTTLTVLITLPNVLFGMYGMNVALPFAEQPWAYALIVVFTFMLILVVYRLAKRSGMF